MLDSPCWNVTVWRSATECGFVLLQPFVNYWDFFVVTSNSITSVVCVDVCVHSWFACVHVHMYMHVYICICACIFACMQVCVCASMLLCGHAYAHTCVMWCDVWVPLLSHPMLSLLYLGLDCIVYFYIISDLLMLKWCWTGCRFYLLFPCPCIVFSLKFNMILCLVVI